MGLDAIGIVSRDLPLSVKFYALLGVALEETGGPEHLEGMTTSGVRIMLDSVALMKEINPAWEAPTGCGVILCFKQDSPKRVDALFSQMEQDGFRAVKAPWDAFWGQRYASVLDPDGNQIDIFASL